MRKKSKEFIKNAVELGLTVGDVSDAIRLLTDTKLPKEEIRRRVRINLQRILKDEYNDIQKRLFDSGQNSCDG